MEEKYSNEYKKTKNYVKLKFFDLKVLDRYKQDPRYKVEEYSVNGSLYIKDEYYLDKKTPKEDKIGIQSFGRAFKKKDNSEVIVTILAYLADLSTKHQAHWESYEINDDCVLDQDFYNQEFKAEFIDRVSVFDAFIQELVEINKLCGLMKEPPLFLKTFKECKPTGFTWITKPTYKGYYDLLHIVDKLISDNLNKDFFKNKIRITNQEEKGTLTLLNEYLTNYFIPKDPRPLAELIKTLKEIRKERRKPAHKLEEDKYDEQYFELQKELIYDSYKSIRSIRLILTNHPGTKEYKPPEELQKGRIL